MGLQVLLLTYAASLFTSAWGQASQSAGGWMCPCPGGHRPMGSASTCNEACSGGNRSNSSDSSAFEREQAEARRRNDEERRRQEEAQAAVLQTEAEIIRNRDAQISNLRELTVSPSSGLRGLPATGAPEARIERGGLQAEIRDAQIRGIVRGIRNITVPPPLLPEEAAIAFGQIAPGDEFNKNVFLGTAVGVGIADVFAKIRNVPLGHLKLILVTGKTFIAAEDAADVYLVKQSETYEKALRWLKDDAKRKDFTRIVRAIKDNRPIPENASIEMVRAAQAILDPRLGNSGTRIAWNAMLSPEARNAALTQLCIELGGEVLGRATKTMVGRLTAQRLPAFREANEYLAKATYALERTNDPAARASLKAAIKQANDIIAQSYAGARGMEHIASIYAGNEIERIHERPRTR
jgi:hypothetical protein